MKRNSIQIERAKLTMTLNNGVETSLDLSPAQLEMFIRGSGIAIHDVDNKKFAYYRFDDKTIEKNILPLLPKIR